VIFEQKGGHMDIRGHEDYVVFIQSPADPNARPESVERELVECATYEEARWVRRENTSPTRRCVIRYVGPAGGGD
jgi:hypothetical protein